MAAKFVQVSAAPEAPGIVHVVALDDDGRLWYRRVFAADRGANPEPSRCLVPPCASFL